MSRYLQTSGPMALLAALAVAAAARAADVTVKIGNGTTGGPGDAQRVELRQIGTSMTLVAAADGVKGEVVLEDLELVATRSYLAVATRDGVDYELKATGEQLVSAQPVTLYVFDQTTEVEGVTITGLNVVVRRQKTGCELEYILTVANEMRPQRTVAADALASRLAVPAGLEDLQAEVYRGPESRIAEVGRGADGNLGARTALPPGKTRIVIKGFWPESGSARLEIGGVLPITAWSMLVSPPDVSVDAPELNQDPGDYSGFARWRGPTLAAGQRVTAQIGPWSGTIPGRAIEPTAAGHDRETAAATAGGTKKSRGFPWPLLILLSLGLLAVGIWRRRS